MEVMRYDQQREVDSLREQFKMMLLASHPNGSKIVAELRQAEDEDGEFAAPVSDDVEVQPRDSATIEAALADLAMLGYAVQDLD